MGPRSGSGGFSSRGGRGVRFGTLAGPAARLALAASVHFPRGQRHDRFPGRRARGEGSSGLVPENLQPLGVWPVRGPWKTLPAAGRGPLRSHGRSTGEACSQCSPTAASVSARTTPLALARVCGEVGSPSDPS